MFKNLVLGVVFMASLASWASADIIVDFTTAGNSNTINTGGFVFATTDPSGTGVSFTVTASAVIPAGGGANGGNVIRLNAGLGSEVENAGDFLNVIGGVSEVLEFTISNVMGLQANQSLVIQSLLSQNGESQSGDQSGGHGGTFGNNANDSVTLVSDSGSSFVVNQSDTGSLGSMDLAADDDNAGNPGNTFAHGAGNLGFTNSFTVQQTDLSRNLSLIHI